MQLRSRYVIILLAFILLGSLPASSNAQQVGFYFEKSRKKQSIPFELYNNLIVVSFSLNGQYPLKFILDTGVRPTILINRSFADSIGLKYEREVELYGVGNQKSLKAQVVVGNSLSSKGVNSDNLSVLVLEDNLLELEKHLGTNIDGILGYDFFKRFIVKINYRKMRVDLFEPIDFTPPKSYSTLPFLLVDSKPYVNLNIQQDSSNTLNAKFLVDTGASHALVLNPSSSDSIALVGKLLDVKMGRSITGELMGKLGRVDQVAFGYFALNQVIASYVQEEQSPIPQHFDKNGCVGGELLRKFTIIFDYYHQNLHVKPNRSFREPFEYNMSGLEFIAVGKDLNRFVINSVRPESSSDQSGLKKGDLLISLNNIPSKKLTLSRIYAELSTKEGKQVHLTVFRNGEYVARSLILKKEI